MGKLKLLGDVVEGGLGMMRNASKAEQELTAAERAAAGRKAAELIKSQPQVKASEALGQLREKGVKRTTTTQADRTRVGGGNIGGAPFSAISEADPNYAGRVWGVMDEGTASRLTNLTDPETAWTTMLGSANQLKTNPIVFDKLKKGFLESMKQGNLSPELEAKINHNLALTFGEGASIRDPKIWKEADTFEKRAALADLMMGQGIPPSKGGVALGGEKSGKGVIFRPTDILKKETEPTLLHTEHGGDVPTFAAGPRLFRLDKESEFRPDLHPGFPTLIKGKDLGYNVIPTPTEIYLPDWHKAFKEKKPERFQGPWSPEIVQRRKSGSYKLKGAEGPGYYDLALGLEGEGLPSQELTDEYIRHLIREGFKDGGKVKVDDFDAKVDKLIENHHFDNHVDKRIKEHFAEGGDVKLARTSLRMAGGGMLGKGMAKLGKRLMADPAEMTASIKGGTRKFGDEMGGNTVVKDVGGNWLRDSTGTSLKTLKRKTQGGMKPEDALVQMRERFSDVPEQQQNIRSLEADVALNKWVDSNLNNYVKKQMGTPEDPVRKLAEEDITHFPIAEDPAFWERRGESSRKKLGGSKMAQSDLAQQWENRTDAIIKRDTAQEHQSMMRQAPGMYEKGDEWINKLAPETSLYTSIMNPRDLGFDHIMDVLRADLQAGRIRPEQLNKVSMEQAVRRTYEYDQEMARKMAEAQFKVTEGMPVKKEYPEGYKWVELTAPKLELEPGHVMGRPSGYPNLHAVIDEKTGQSVSIGATPEEAIKLYKREEREKNLGSALKYEGETMGHCVGSYCPDVLEGKSRIFSLRDSKGEPHVTIETQPRSVSTWDDVTAAVGPEESQKLWKEFDDIGGNNMSDVGQGFDMFIKQKGIQAPEKIIQIKGKGNAKPKEDYLPFVQDFVRGDNWSDVGDFKNTGLEWHATGPKGIFGQDEVKRLEQAGYKVPKYLTNAEKDDLTRKWYELETGNDYDTGLPKATPKPEAPPAEGMANGGGILKYTTLRMGKGGLLGKGAKALAGAMKGEQLTSQAIGKAAESAGMKAPVTANKPLTTAQDFNTSLGDSIRQRMARDQELMDSLNYKYDKGQRVFTEDSAQKNWPPMTVLGRVLEGNRMMREDPKDILSKKIIDEATGKPKRTPHEPGYKVRLEHSPDNWSEFVIPESAIKGNVEMARGGGVLKYSTLRNRNTTQSQPNRFADGGKSEMKATPRKKGYGVASDVLKGVHEFASKPFGYENPPVEFISELLGIPAASRVLDKLSYGEPITNAGKANVPLIPDDTFDAATAGLGGLGAASKLAKPIAKAAKKLPKDLPVGMSIKPVGTSIFGEKIMPTARIGLEAPGILIPSKMNNVREAVRNTKGNYGARRVERAADEIPNLERMYQEDALKEAFTGDNASAMMSINPSDFEKFARELERKTSVGPKAAELAKQGDIDKMTVTTDEYIKHLQRLKDGFSDVPYLNLNKDEVGLPTMPKVIGHEGRHRNRALADAGEKSSLVKINPRGDLREGMPRRTQEDYIEALREELERSNRLVLPETDPWFRRPEIQLPDIYAKGGPILKHTTLRNRRANQRVR